MKPAASIFAALALALLGYASVRSQVMQAAMPAAPSAAPAVDAMAGMAMAAAQVAHAPAPRAGAARKTVTPVNCAYCSVAGHVPVLDYVAPMRAPVGFVFARWRAISSRGPCGPPETTPRARGPPGFLLQG